MVAAKNEITNIQKLKSKKWPTSRSKCAKADESKLDEIASALSSVRKYGDKAVRSLAKRKGGCPRRLLISSKAIDEAVSALSDKRIMEIEERFKTLRSFLLEQMPEDVSSAFDNGAKYYRRHLPIRSIGICLPANADANLTLKLALPAAIAECEEIIICLPTLSNEPMNAEVLYAARLCGTEKVYAAGGVEAVGAMAYGTDSIQPVEKIFGYGDDIDLAIALGLVKIQGIEVARECEKDTLVVADETANATDIAQFLLMQGDEKHTLICPNRDIANNIKKEMSRLARKKKIDIAAKELIALVFEEGNFRELSMECANKYGPGILALCVEEPQEMAENIFSASVILLGVSADEMTIEQTLAFTGTGMDAYMKEDELIMY